MALVSNKSINVCSCSAGNALAVIKLMSIQYAGRFVEIYMINIYRVALI